MTTTERGSNLSASGSGVHVGLSKDAADAAAADAARDDAAQEGAAVTADESQRRKHSRQIRWSAHHITIIAMWAFSGGYLAAASVWFVHLVTPWAWLSDMQLDKLQSLLLGSIFGVLFNQTVWQVRSTYAERKK